MKTPIAAFIEWLTTLPVSHRQEVAVFVINFSPGYGDFDPLLVEMPDEVFTQKLLEYADDKSNGVGVVLGLRAVIEFFLMSRRGSREGWGETQSFLAGARQHFEQLGNDRMVERAEQILREVPFNREQWLSTAEKWRALREAELSDEYIGKWWKS